MLKSISTMSLAAAIVFATYLSASAAGKLDMIKTRGSIIVGIDFSHPPFGAINEKAEQVGSDLETAQLLAKDLGVKLETVNVSGTLISMFAPPRRAAIATGVDHVHQ